MTTTIDDEIKIELDELAVDSAKCDQARKVYEAIRRRRDARITTLREKGVPVEQLCERTELSHQRISQILKR